MELTKEKALELHRQMWTEICEYNGTEEEEEGEAE